MEQVIAWLLSSDQDYPRNLDWVIISYQRLGDRDVRDGYARSIYETRNRGQLFVLVNGVWVSLKGDDPKRILIAAILSKLCSKPTVHVGRIRFEGEVEDAYRAWMELDNNIVFLEYNDDLRVMCRALSWVIVDEVL